MKLCIFSSVILGLIAHAFRYFNLQFSSDTLNRIFIDEDIIIGKLEQGRFTNHVLMSLRHLYYAPWLIGIISLLLVAVSAYLITDLFEIDNNISICLVAGLMAVNHTLTIINASFSYVADVYMWTILMFVLAAYILIKYSRWFHIAIAGVLIAIAIAAYQSYVPFVPSIVLIWVIIRSFDDSDIKTSIIKIVNTIISVVIAGILYVLGLVIFVKGQGLEFVGRFDAVKPADGNVLINLVKVIVDSYIYVAKFFLQRTFYNNNLLRSINALLILFVGFVVRYLLIKLKISVKNKVIILVSCALFPLVMNSVFVVFNGRMMHHLMTYHFMIAYVFVIVLLDYVNKKQVLSDKTVSYMNKIIYIGIMLINLLKYFIC